MVVPTFPSQADTPKYPLAIVEPESGVHRALIGQRGLENYPITNFEGPNGYLKN